jgi:hypothetical protein
VSARLPDGDRKDVRRYTIRVLSLDEPPPPIACQTCQVIAATTVPGTKLVTDGASLKHTPLMRRLAASPAC